MSDDNTTDKVIGCAIDRPLTIKVPKPVSDPFFENVEKLTPEQKERETLIYWLIRAYHSGHREGWEEGPSTDETMDGLLCVLANRGYDPNEDHAAEELLKTKPRF